MTIELTVDRHSEWRQEYRGVMVKISFWGQPDMPTPYGPETGVLVGKRQGMNDGFGMWNYYLTLVPEMFVDGKDFEKFWLPVNRTDERGRVFYDYYVSPLADLNWHGEITYYEKHQDPDNKKRFVKMGCDYGHFFDQEAGYPYSKDSVWFDGCRSVDALHKLFPNLKMRCGYNGKYYSSDQGEVNKYGNWWSFEGTADNEKWKASFDAEARKETP